MRTRDELRKAAMAGLLGVVVGLLAPSHTQAKLTKIMPDGPTSWPIGAVSTFFALDDGANPITNYKWEFVALDDGCNPTPVLLKQGEDSYLDYIRYRPGKFRILCTATYGPTSGNPDPPPPDQVQVDGETLGPTTSKIVEGLNTPADRNEGITLRVRMMYGDIDVGTFITGIPQEMVTKEDGTVLGWGPDQPTPDYYIDGNTIVDTQRQNPSDAMWNALDVMESYDYINIQHRLVINNPCGQQQKFPMKIHTLRKRKVSATQWQVEEVE